MSLMSSPFEKLKKSLSRTKENLLGRISSVLSSRRVLDDDLLEEIEEILIEADVGVAAAERLITSLRLKARTEKPAKDGEVIDLLKAEIATILSRSPSPASPAAQGTKGRPVIWLITGVNGVGKTTTIGKLATWFSRQGDKVIIGACDTFRAAAIDQISIWAGRAGVELIRSQEGADPAAVAFDAASAAAARQADLLLIDTAGRLHTKSNLMEELKKIKRVVLKAAPNATVLSKLIIDGTTGQNAVSQARAFTEAVGCDGLIVTKLDGTAKGGVVLALAEELGVPVDFIGLGEGVDDLQPFDPTQFAEALCQ